MDECWACERLFRLEVPILQSQLEAETDIALCRKHFSWWVARYLNSADDPPCSAHVIEESGGSPDA